MKKPLILGIALAAIEIVAACGGNVVVDPNSAGTGAGSLGGASGLGGTSGVGMGGAGGATCGANLGTGVTQCGAGVGSGAGAMSCEYNFCDMATGVTWVAICQGSTCECEQLSGDGGVAPQCVCTLPAGVDACTTNTNCCYTTQ